MMKKSVCLSQDSNLGSLIYLYGLIQPIRGRNRVKDCKFSFIARLVKNLKYYTNFNLIDSHKERKFTTLAFMITA